MSTTTTLLTRGKDRFKKIATTDNIVDLFVDLALLLFDVITSPILIVMRLARWTVGKYMLDGVKNRIKRLVYWLKQKPWWVSVIVIPISIVILFYVLIFVWLTLEMFDPEIWKEDNITIDNAE